MKSLNSARDFASHGGLLRLFVSLTAFCLILPVYAVDPNRAMTQYVRDHWGIEQGFPGGPLYAITQTTDGYLWIGTQSGLFRFDGWRFSQVQDPSGAFSLTGVYGLTPDRDGSLWILSENQVLLHYKNGTFERPHFDEVSPGNVSAISRSSRGELLVSKMEGGTFDQRGAEFQRLDADDALPRSPIISLAQTSNGDVWMGTRDVGLFRLSGNKILAVRKGLPDLKVNCLAADGDQNLWVGTDNGVVRWNGNELTAAGIPASRNHFQALAMVKDRDGNLWVGADSQGLLRFNTQGVASLPERGVLHNAVTAVFEDREGDVWFGGTGGVERLRDSPFVTYSTPEGLPADGSKPVYVDAENRMWFPPVTGGLWWVKGAQYGRISND